VKGEFLAEILDTYRRYNEDFYIAMDGK